MGAGFEIECHCYSLLSRWFSLVISLSLLLCSPLLSFNGSLSSSLSHSSFVPLSPLSMVLSHHLSLTPSLFPSLLFQWFSLIISLSLFLCSTLSSLNGSLSSSLSHSFFVPLSSLSMVLSHHLSLTPSLFPFLLFQWFSLIISLSHSFFVPLSPMVLSRHLSLTPPLFHSPLGCIPASSRFSSLPHPPCMLLAECLKCVSVMAAYDPQQVRGNLTLTPSHTHTITHITHTHHHRYTNAHTHMHTPTYTHHHT